MSSYCKRGQRARALPGKALLPVAGYPSAVLAALRAANKGTDVIVATSEDTSDDALASELHKHEVRVVRGVIARCSWAFSSGG
jgi:spore coat polysaccharide biosynthesis protein SpsF